MQTVTILGSTGSIGQSTLSVVSQNPEQFKIVALTANNNIKLLYQQCLQFNPRYAVVLNTELASQLKQRLAESHAKTEVWCGEQAICNAATEADIVVSAIVGAAGLLPTLAAVKARKKILLANKESLVMGGDFFMQQVREHQATLLPVDSEHNAIFQCLPSDYLPGQSLSVNAVTLTASGGPFRNTPQEQLPFVTPVQAVAHPNWKMGTKISIDSATMMNKGLEVIEAAFLFGLPLEKIKVVIHPQSIIHSFVEFQDHSILAQLGTPDMRIPIAYALSWPKRITSGAKPLDLSGLTALTFEKPDVNRFPCLRLAYQALKAKGSATAILNAANEIAVQAFCAGKIKFTDIAVLIDAALQNTSHQPIDSLEALLAIDQAVRNQTLQKVDCCTYRP